jgi:hypothetical protein
VRVGAWAVDGWTSIRDWRGDIGITVVSQLNRGIYT